MVARGDPRSGLISETRSEDIASTEVNGGKRPGFADFVTTTPTADIWQHLWVGK
jgi:hypothetical protein